MSSNTLVENEISQAAITRAETLNWKYLSQALKKAGPQALHNFIGANSDAVEACLAANKRPSLATFYDDAMTIIKGADRAAASAMKKTLADTARLFVAKTPLDFTDIETYGLRFKPTTPQETQAKLNADAARRASVFITLGSGNRRTLAVGKYVASALAYPFKALGLAAHNSIHAIGDYYESFAHMRGWSETKRKLILGMTTATAIGGVLMPYEVSAHNRFAADAALSDNFKEACADPRIRTGPALTAAFAVAYGNERSPVAQMHILSAMQSLEYGMSPAPALMITTKETGNFRFATAPNSTASGAWQSITSTKLLWLSQHAQTTPYYKQMRATMESVTASTPARAQARAFVLAIDTTVADYKKNPTALINAAQNRRLNLAQLSALNEADNPVFSGQLMAAELKMRAPYLSAANLEGKSLEQIVRAVGRFYHTHLMGPTGAEFLEYVALKAPNIRMDNTAELQRLYTKFRPGAPADQAKFFGGYYKGIVGGNPGPFPRGAKITPARFSEDIHAFSRQWSEPVARKIMAELKNGDDAITLCLNDPQIVRQIAPLKTNMLMEFGATVAANIPAGLRTRFADALDTGITLARELVGSASAGQRDMTIEEILYRAGQPDLNEPEAAPTLPATPVSTVTPKRSRAPAATARRI